VPPDENEDPYFAAADKKHDPYAALRIADYRRLVLACVASSIGGEIQAVAIGWELYERTRSATVLGLIGLVQLLPVYLLALPSGHAADRYSRTRLFVIAEALLALAAAGMAVLSFGGGPVWAFYACLALTGTGQALLRPARWALMPQVVPRDLLQNAVTWNSTSWQTAAIAGPAIGGTIIALAGGAAWAYVLTAVLSGLAIVQIGSIRAKPAPNPTEPTTLGTFLAGFKFIWSNDLILATITLDLFAVLLGGAQALLPMFASDILHVGPAGLGWLRSAESIGALMMALTLAHRRPFQKAGPTLVVAVTAFGLAMVGFGLSRDVRLSFLMLLIAGAVDNISVVVRSTLIQTLTPDSMRGRVSAVNSLFIGTSNELGGFESGLTAAFFGPIASVVGGGIGTLVVVAVVVVAWPRLLSLGPLHKPS
ncbi:MAG TPA: MFS transporter, partial [Isosphaeraceae bacterium]